MKRTKILAFILTVALLITQFSMLGTTVFAASALTGRSDFAKGVNIHRAEGYAAYNRKTITALADAKALGSNFVRTGVASDINADIGTISAAAKDGMQVMLTISLPVTSGSSTISASNIDIAGITSQWTEYATKLRGKVAYYQLGNELDTVYKKSGNSGYYTYNYNDVSGAAVAIYAAHNAIKAADPSAKTVVNFGWYHYGFLEALKAVRIDTRTGRVAASGTSSSYIAYADWDVTGFDWYASDDASATAYQSIISTVVSKFSKDVIVCEANVRATGSSDGETVTYNDTPTWLQNFATYCYNNSRVKGFFVYELYDEPAFSYTGNSYVFNRESHFGLIDKHGNKKAMYETVRSLYGGTGTVSGFCLPAAQAESTTVHNFWGKELYFGAYGLNAINSTTDPDRWLPGTFGDSHIMLDSKFDFTKYDYFEFDYYVDNLANFQSRVTSLTVGIVHEDGGHNQTTDFRYLLTQNGWNHVRVPINKGTAEDWVIANAKQFRFKIEMPASTTAAYEIYAIANVCAVKEPDVPVPGMAIPMIRLTVLRVFSILWF